MARAVKPAPGDPGARLEGGTTPASAPVRWQRVVWHPVLDELRGPAPVTVRGDVHGRRATLFVSSWALSAPEP